ncbi:TapB family protein [Abyssalbus ytuae]|uniref:DUF3108 domain-containing protein n=1 Tax=Abyssalbus ytuae TaxID=2926907 RepID=A0A9E6ZY38_9FLAO|nr:hypothetical protein [Abyssalbus ytuae]UOB17317.1 hypothetical protein MQE35_16470 [Abyssalbus ytuae]
MKNFLLLLFVLISHYNLPAQECEAFAPANVGTILKYNTFNKSGELMSRYSHELTEIKNEEGAKIFEITLTTYDKTGKKIYLNTYNAECFEGNFYMDMMLYADQNKLANYQNYDLNVEGDFLEFPRLMKTSTRLLDGEILIELNNSNNSVIKITTNVTDRKLIDKELLSTPAGNFNCYKMNYSLKLSTGTSVETKNITEWYAKDVGIVKTEFFNTKNSLINYTELVEISR